jgi:hypothetical protein
MYDPTALLAARGYRMSATVRMIRRITTKNGVVLEVGAHARIVSVRDDGCLTLEGLRANSKGEWTLGDRKIVGPVSPDACEVVRARC